MNEAIEIVEMMRSALQNKLHCKCYEDEIEAKHWNLTVAVYDDVIAELKKECPRIGFGQNPSRR